MSWKATENSMCAAEVESKVFGQCDECGEDIVEGETYYEIGIDRYCSACVKTHMFVAGEE